MLCLYVEGLALRQCVNFVDLKNADKLVCPGKGRRRYSRDMTSESLHEIWPAEFIISIGSIATGRSSCLCRSNEQKPAKKVCPFLWPLGISRTLESGIPESDESESAHLEEEPIL